MEWLFIHSEDADIDEPLKPPPKAESAGGSGAFAPNAMLFQQLKDMGFAERDVIAALELSHNSFEVACEFLLGGSDDRGAFLRGQDVGRHEPPAGRDRVEPGNVAAHGGRSRFSRATARPRGSGWRREYRPVNVQHAEAVVEAKVRDVARKALGDERRGRRNCIHRFCLDRTAG